MRAGRCGGVGSAVHLAGVGGPRGSVLVIGGAVYPPNVAKDPLGAHTSTTLYSFDAGTWAAGPTLNVGRRDAACATFHPASQPHGSLVPRSRGVSRASTASGMVTSSELTVAVFGGSLGYNNNVTELGSIEVLQIPAGAVSTAAVAALSWKVAPAVLAPPRSGAAAAATPDGSGVVIVGGFRDFGVYLDETVLFDGQRIIPKASFPFARASLNLVTLPAHGHLAAFGGGATMPAYNETVFYSPASNQWTAGPPLIEGAGRNRAAAAVLSPKRGEEWVVTTGGFSLNPFFDPMQGTECLSSAASKWVQTASSATPCVTTPLPSARGDAAAAAINGSCLVVIGGAPTTTDVLQLCLL